MRIDDPFPAEGCSSLSPTHAIDWPALAWQLVHGTLKLGRGERVILSADPYYHGAMLDHVRREVQRAGAIELASILHWTPGIAVLRGPGGNKADPAEAADETRAMTELFALADVFIWLANDWRSRRPTHAIGQSEEVLATWRGRSAHFHWFHDPANPDPEDAVNRAIDKVYERAVLELDYPALARRQRALAAAMAGRRVRVTDPAGTDVSFTMTERFHFNDGDASLAKARDAASARDREEELPCGALRSIPLRDSVDGVIAFTSGFGFPSAGTGLNVNRFFDHGLRLHFKEGHLTRLETDGDQALLDALWASETGDKDRLGEFVLGCNPLLVPVPGSGFRPYYGFGDGVLRLTLGENLESGGINRSSTHRWLMFTAATISVDGTPLVVDGRIVQPFGA